VKERGDWEKDKGGERQIKGERGVRDSQRADGV